MSWASIINHLSPKLNLVEWSQGLERKSDHTHFTFKQQLWYFSVILIIPADLSPKTESGKTTVTSMLLTTHKQRLKCKGWRMHHFYLDAMIWFSSKTYSLSTSLLTSQVPDCMRQCCQTSILHNDKRKLQWSGGDQCMSYLSLDLCFCKLVQASKLCFECQILWNVNLNQYGWHSLAYPCRWAVLWDLKCILSFGKVSEITHTQCTDGLRDQVLSNNLKDLLDPVTSKSGLFLSQSMTFWPIELYVHCFGMFCLHPAVDDALCSWLFVWTSIQGCGGPISLRMLQILISLCVFVYSASISAIAADGITVWWFLWRWGVCHCLRMFFIFEWERVSSCLYAWWKLYLKFKLFEQISPSNLLYFWVGFVCCNEGALSTVIMVLHMPLPFHKKINKPLTFWTCVQELYW